jgi:hypothetical protein
LLFSYAGISVDFGADTFFSELCCDEGDMSDELGKSESCECGDVLDILFYLSFCESADIESSALRVYRIESICIDRDADRSDLRSIERLFS